MHSRRRLEGSRRTSSASTTCLAMSWVGLPIAGTPTTMARLLMARRGSLETVVAAWCVALPGTLASASPALPCVAGSPRPLGSPASGSAWPEHSRNLSTHVHVAAVQGTSAVMMGATGPIGFIGLGTMGEAMALTLVKAGMPLLVWNRTRAKAETVAAAGAQVAREAADVFARSATVFL